MAGARGLPALAVVAMILVLAKPRLFGGQPLLSTELPANQFSRRRGQIHPPNRPMRCTAKCS